MRNFTFNSTILVLMLFMLGNETNLATILWDLDSHTAGMHSHPTLPLNNGFESFAQSYATFAAVVQEYALSGFCLLGALLLLNARHLQSVRTGRYKRVSYPWVFWALALLSPLGFAAQDINADLNGDALVNSQDISKLSSCFGQDPLSNRVCAVADVDKDADVDMDDASFVSTRLGQFYPWALYPIPSKKSVGIELLELADMNGDAKLDVITIIDEGAIEIYLGNGDGTLQDPQSFDGIHDNLFISMALGDVNGDNQLDVVAIQSSWDSHSTLSTYLGNGDGTLQDPQSFYLDDGGRIESVALGDVNGDDQLDVILYDGILGYHANVLVYLGNGDSTFQDSQIYTMGRESSLMTQGDVNGDGRHDVLFTKNNALFVGFGNRDGFFQESQLIEPQLVTQDYNINYVSLGDLNSDSQQDIVLVTFNYENPGYYLTLLLGNRDGTFQSLQSLRLFVQDFEYSIRNVILDDVNRDGKLDAVVAASHQYIAVLLGNGDGTFQHSQVYTLDPTPAYPLLLTLDDMNGDNTPDAVIRLRGTLQILPGNGNGAFWEPQRIIAGDGTDSLVLGDVNTDGILDIVGDSEVLLGNGDGSFQSPLSLAANNVVALEDVNRDDTLDVVGYTDNHIMVQFGNGRGGFQQPKYSPTYKTLSSLTLGDVNGDGHLDAVGTSNNDITLQLGNSDSSFQEPQPITSSYRIISPALGDINGDAQLDLVYISQREDYQQKIIIQFGNGDGSFQSPTNSLFLPYIELSSISLYDLNGDHALDIVAVDDSFPQFFVKISNADGNFQEWQTFYSDLPIPNTDFFYTSRDSFGITFGDVNKDGVLDAVANLYGISVLLGKGDGSFLKPQLFQIGPKTGSIALGDVNGDDRLDILMAGEEITLLPNQIQTVAP
jgi:hypothetical protein